MMAANVSLRHLALGVSNCRPITRLAGHVQEAEQLGVRRAFIAEDIGCRDAFQAAVVASRAATSMDLTIAVTNPYLRSPGALAEAVMTLSELARGRVRLGLGSSSEAVISGQLGLEYGKPVSIMRHTVESLRWELDQRDASFHLRLTLAAMGPMMLRLAGEIADEVILNTGSTPAYVRWAAGEVATGASRAGGRQRAVRIAVWIPVYLDSNERAALDRARRWAAGMLGVPRQGELLLKYADPGGHLDDSFLVDLRAACGTYPVSGDPDRGAATVPESVVRALCVVGDVGEALVRLPAYLEAGADTLILGPGPLAKVATALNDKP